MVMFKAKFRPLGTDKPAAGARLQRQQQQQPQPQPPQPRPEDERDDEAPPIEKERGPQYPIKEPGPGNPPERVKAPA